MVNTFFFLLLYIVFKSIFFVISFFFKCIQFVNYWIELISFNFFFTGAALIEEMERMKERHTCKICMDAQVKVVFLPCTHMATCSGCAVALSQCPMCRGDIKYSFNPIIS